MRFPYNEALKNELKAYPGVQWRKAEWGGNDWHLPREAVPHCAAAAKRFGYEWDDSSVPLPGVAGPTPVLNPRLWPFQQDHVRKALRALPQEGAFILNNEMGLGKSPEALEILRNLLPMQPGAVLIVSPAMVRETWRRALDEWWPGHPEVEVVRDGKQAAVVGGGGIVLTSYGLLPKLPKLAYGAVVLDELHYLQGDAAARTLVVERLLRSQATPPIALGLTGTLISNQPLSIWKPLDVLYPGRFGTRNGFGARYCLADSTGFGNTYHGANPDTAPELKSRLGAISARATKTDPAVRQLLPPFLVNKVYVPRRGRLSAVTELVTDFRAQGASRIAILTHRREFARDIGAAVGRLLGAGTARGSADGSTAPTGSAGIELWPDPDNNGPGGLRVQRVQRDGRPMVGIVTGEVPPAARDKLLQELGTCVSGAVLSATMHSVGIGIDLTWAEEVILAELDYSPTAVLQALGRFSRLSGKRGVRITILLQEGSDPVGESLASKVGAAGLVLESGQAGSVVEDLGSRGTTLNPQEMDALLLGMVSEVEDE